MPSTDYDHLVTMFDEIKKTLLPQKQKLIGSYNKHQITKTKALILMGHAELEHYFETRVLDILKSTQKKWNKNKKVNWVLHSLILNYEGLKKLEDKNLETVVKAVIERHRDIVKDTNNGIKRKNIRGMLGPIGIYLTTLDETLLTSLDDLGFKRGLLAHKSNSMTVTQATNPFDEAKAIDDIISLIFHLDSELDRIQRKRA